jgi:hypothetical protein
MYTTTHTVLVVVATTSCGDNKVQRTLKDDQTLIFGTLSWALGLLGPWDLGSWALGHTWPWVNF